MDSGEIPRFASARVIAARDDTKGPSVTEEIFISPSIGKAPVGSFADGLVLNVVLIL